MAITYEIPTAPRAERFTISLAGVAYQLTLYWCAPTNSWVLDIADAGGAPLVCGIPVVPGIDLVAQHQHLGFGGQIIAVVDGDAAAVPNYSGMGTTGHLYFLVG